MLMTKLKIKQLLAALLSYLAIHCVSASDRLEPGKYIPSLFDKRYSAPFIVQKLTDSSYVALVSAHNATFYVGEKGVLLIDTTLHDTAPALLSAVQSVTSLPITTVIYSHYHMDHVGGANIISENAEGNGTKINFVATEAVASQIKRHGNKIPTPTTILKNTGEEFEFEDMKVRVHVPFMGGGHSTDNSIIYLAEEKLLHYVDLIHPELLFPYFNLGLYDVAAAEKSLHEVLGMDWDYVNGGHGNIGSKKDVKELLTYLDDLKSAVKNSLSSVSFTAHIHQGPGVGVYSWIRSYDEAIAEHVRQNLQNKYGHLPNFDAIIPSHATAIKEYITLY